LIGLWLDRKGIALQPDEFHKPGHWLQGESASASRELEMYQQLGVRPWQPALRPASAARGQQLWSP